MCRSGALGRRGFEDEDAAGSFRYEHPAVRREGDVPWVLETALYDRGVDRVERPPDEQSATIARDDDDGEREPPGAKKRLAVALVDAGSRLMRRRMPNALLGGLHVGRAGTARV